MFSSLYNAVFYRPLLNALVWLTGILPTHDVGLAIIILTLAVQIILFPFKHKGLVTQKKIKKIEPELKAIKEKHKGDQQEQAQKTMDLYKQHGINPFSGFISLFVQIPIILALYKVFLSGVEFDFSRLYSFVSTPTIINTTFVGLIDVTVQSYTLALLAALSHFIQMIYIMPATPKKNIKEKSFKDDLARSMSLQFKYVMPIVIFFIALKLSAGIALYWTTTNVFAIVHGIVVKKIDEKQHGKTNSNNQIVTGNVT